MAADIRVLKARKIITMNSYRPVATHVAIREGRILGVGSLEDVAGWGPYDLDETFADKVLMPGFVEGHSHASEGRFWEYTYVGFQGRRDPDGRQWPGVEGIEPVVARLQAEEAKLKDPDAPLFAWGFDPIYFGGRRMEAADLDRVSSTRPVVVLHSNGHLMNVNSVVLDRAGIDARTNIEGVTKGADGKPTGELAEMAARFMAFRVTGNPFGTGMTSAVLRRFGQSACFVGVTTATDLHALLDDATVETYRVATSDPAFPMRLVPAFAAVSAPAAEGIAKVKRLQRTSTDKLRYGLVKVMSDGSIQGFSGRLKWPGYYNGHANGVWNAPPSQLMELVQAYHEAGLHIHIHTNGDEASELMIDAIELALQKAPRADHRHTLQHCQMADEAQFRRMAKLGICVNLFANHLYYWGDQHAAITMGPDRAARLDATGTAHRLGVHYAIHSDAPVTPLAPLFTAWCAVNRRTMSGKVLGPEECLTVDQALRAITLGAAYTLKMDHLVGSIESGKFADFAVLEDDPLSVPPEALKDVPVWGTVLAGVPFQAPPTVG